MKNRDPLCEAAEGVAETQQCLGATQQVRGSPKGGEKWAGRVRGLRLRAHTQ